MYNQLDKELEILSDIEIEKHSLDDEYTKTDLQIMKKGIIEHMNEQISKSIQEFWERRKPNRTEIIYQCPICLIEINPIHGTQEHRSHRNRLDYLSPCACSGVNKYIHLICYRELIIRGSSQCGVCKMNYPSYSRYSYSSGQSSL